MVEKRKATDEGIEAETAKRPRLEATQPDPQPSNSYAIRHPREWWMNEDHGAKLMRPHLVTFAKTRGIQGYADLTMPAIRAELVRLYEEWFAAQKRKLAGVGDEAGRDEQEKESSEPRVQAQPDPAVAPDATDAAQSVAARGPASRPAVLPPIAFQEPAGQGASANRRVLVPTRTCTQKPLVSNEALPQVERVIPQRLRKQFSGSLPQTQVPRRKESKEQGELLVNAESSASNVSQGALISKASPATRSIP